MTLPSGYRPSGNHGAAGPVVVLEGVSGVGKSTLAAVLQRQLGATRLHTLPPPHTAWTSQVSGRLAALPQFAFYLSGVLHASDIIRRSRPAGPVVADRYLSSVIACHAAVHGLPTDAVRRMVEPYRSYFVAPTATFYLRCSQDELRRRLAAKVDRRQDDNELMSVPGRLSQLDANFAEVAADDPSAVIVETDDRSVDELAQQVFTHLERHGA